jgi:hypothetical protein
MFEKSSRPKKFPKNSKRIPKEFQIIPNYSKKFQKKLQKKLQKIPKNSKKFHIKLQKIPKPDNVKKSRILSQIDISRHCISGFHT